MPFAFRFPPYEEGRKERSGVMKRLSTIILFLLTIIPMMAQIRVSAPQQVAVGEQFRLQYIISTTDVKGFRAGSIPDAFEQ